MKKVEDSIKFTNKTLETILKECESVLDELSIDHYPIDRISFDKLNGFFGKCIPAVNTADNTLFCRIKISSDLKRDGINFTLQDLKSLVMHEVIHTIKDLDRKFYVQQIDTWFPETVDHGEKWNLIANQIMSSFPDYNLLNAKSYDDIFCADLPVIQTYICPSCGHTHTFRNPYKHIRDEHCPFCFVKYNLSK